MVGYLYCFGHEERQNRILWLKSWQKKASQFIATRRQKERKKGPGDQDIINKGTLPIRNSLKLRSTSCSFYHITLVLSAMNPLKHYSTNELRVLMIQSPNPLPMSLLDTIQIQTSTVYHHFHNWKIWKTWIYKRTLNVLKQSIQMLKYTSKILKSYWEEWN